MLSAMAVSVGSLARRYGICVEKMLHEQVVVKYNGMWISGGLASSCITSSK